MVLDDRIRRQPLFVHQPRVIPLNIACCQLLQSDFAKLRLKVILDHAAIAVRRRFLNLRQDNVLVPVIKPLRKGILAWKNISTLIHFDLMCIECLCCLFLCRKGLVLANAFA